MTDNQFSDGCAFVNGEYVPIAAAAIPILDMGFLRSDVTYDVVGVWNGKFFRLEDHLTRFEKSWNRLRMSPDINPEGIRDALIECVRLRKVSCDLQSVSYTLLTLPTRSSV